jgi:peptidoglycan/LPS O-acetylase OafA/YrhL
MYPLFLVTHLLLFTAGPIVGYAWLGEVGWREWLLRFVQNLLLLPGVFDLPIAQAVAWSLSYELLFYLIAAAGYSACTARVPRAVRGLLGAFAIGAAVWALSQSPTVWFFVGGALLHAVRSDVIRWFVARPGWASVLGIAGFAGMLVATRLSATVALAAGTMCFATLVAERGWLSRVLAQRWITHLGQISYSFYLWQLIVMFVVKRVAIAAMPVVGPTGAVVLFVAGSTVLSLMVAQLSYRWIEVSLAALLFDRRRKESQRSMARAA